MKRSFRVHLTDIDPDQDVREEMEAHLELEVERLIASGVPEPEAKREAEARFGDRDRFEADAKREARSHQRRLRWRNRVDSLALDLRYSLRRLRRSPGFTLAAVSILAIGIGGNSATFSVLKEAILAEPPYPEPERLVLPSIAHVYPSYTYHGASYPEFEIIRDAENRLVDPIEGYTYLPVTLAGVGEAERLDAEVVSEGYFDLLGASAILGRTFAPDEGDRGSPPLVTVIGDALWATHFGRDRNAVGRQILVNGTGVTIVGIMPPGFRGVTGKGRLWLPLAASGVLLDQWRTMEHGAHWFSLLGRLRPGANPRDAEAQLTPLASEIRRVWPDHGRTGDLVPAVRPFKTVATNDRIRTSLVLLSSAAALVLLMVCANLAGLLLARAGSRARETATRLSLGAGRWRIARQCLMECLVVSVAGGLAGIALAVWGVGWLPFLSPESQVLGSNDLQFVDFRQVGIDGGVVLYSVGLSVIVGLFFGALPAFQLSRHRQLAELRASQGATTGGRVLPLGLDMRNVLVSGQVAVAVVLLVGAGLMLFSLTELNRVETGVEEQNLLTFSYTLPHSAAESTSPHFILSEMDAQAAMAFHQRFLTRLRSVPGILGATMGCPPLGGGCGSGYVRGIEGRPEIPLDDAVRVGAIPVEAAYFEVVGAQVLEGRSFSPADGDEAPRVLVLNQAAARILFPNEAALGQRLSMGHSAMPEGETAEVVGVVADILYRSPEAGPQPVVYLSSQQVPSMDPTFIVRTGNAPLTVLPLVRAEMATVDGNVPIHRVSTVEDLGVQATGSTHFVMKVLLFFAGFACILAVMGIYAAVAYAVSLRSREIGIRVALGARSDQALSLFLRRGAIVAGAGVLAGLGAAWVAARFVSSLLFEVGAADPVTYALAGSILFSAALLATYLPARKATRVNPVEVLRAE